MDKQRLYTETRSNPSLPYETLERNYFFLSAILSESLDLGQQPSFFSGQQILNSVTRLQPEALKSWYLPKGSQIEQKKKRPKMIKSTQIARLDGKYLYQQLEENELTLIPGLMLCASVDDEQVSFEAQSRWTRLTKALRRPNPPWRKSNHK